MRFIKRIRHELRCLRRNRLRRSYIHETWRFLAAHRLLTSTRVW